MQRFHPVSTGGNTKELIMQHLQELLLPQQRQVLLKNRAGKNYVKVKHNGTYSTQYLHMSKIFVRRGQRVNQGDVIVSGKTGSTGLATCVLSFWKNEYK
jgi:hypothetical protein